MRAITARLRDFWIDHIWLDYVVAGLLLGVHVIAIQRWQWLDVFDSALPQDRRAVYSAAAVVVSLLGSFSAVAIGQLSSAKGERADLLREVGGADLARNWRSIFRSAMMCALIALSALLLDPSMAAAASPADQLHWNVIVPISVRWLFEASLILMIVRFMRLSALFVEVLGIASMGDSNVSDELAGPPTPTPGWAKRRIG
jgi:hypothetical protein